MAFGREDLSSLGKTVKPSSGFDRQSDFFATLRERVGAHIEHHLFLNVSYRHYPRIHSLALKTAKQRGLEPVRFPTLAGAIRAYSRFLRTLGQPERETNL